MESPWTECKEHPAIYYDASYYKKCPACQNEVLSHALAQYFQIDMQFIDFAVENTKWFGMTLDSLSNSTSDSLKEERSASANAQYDRVVEQAKGVNSKRAAFWRYIRENGLGKVLEGDESRHFVSQKRAPKFRLYIAF